MSLAALGATLALTTLVSAQMGPGRLPPRNNDDDRGAPAGATTGGVSAPAGASDWGAPGNPSPASPARTAAAPARTPASAPGLYGVAGRPIRDLLILDIHTDLMNARDDFPIFAQYDETCLEEVDGHLEISYFPRERDMGALRLPRQPDQLQIRFEEIDPDQDWQTQNDLANIRIAQFPQLRLLLVMQSVLSQPGAREWVKAMILRNSARYHRQLNTYPPDDYDRLAVEQFRPVSRSQSVTLLPDRATALNVRIGPPQVGDVLAVRTVNVRSGADGRGLVALDVEERALADTCWAIRVALFDRDGREAGMAEGVYRMRVRPEDYPAIRQGMLELELQAGSDPERAASARVDLERRPFGATADLVWRARRVDMSDAFHEYHAASLLLHQGAPRAEVAQAYREAASLRPEARYGRIAAELAGYLEEMAAEDARFVEPSGLGLMQRDEYHRYLVHRIRDINVRQASSQARLSVLNGASDEDNPAVALRNAGLQVGPLLLDLLTDRRPTRSYAGLGGAGHVLRYCDVALEILADLAGTLRSDGSSGFDPRSGADAYLGSADAAEARQIIERVHAWWEDNQPGPVDTWGGEAVQGLEARLAARSAHFRLQEVPAFLLDVRNTGSREWSVALSQQLCEVEINGEWYVWGGSVDVQTAWLSPGRLYREIPLSLTSSWVRRSDRQSLSIGRGVHTIRVAMLPRPKDDQVDSPIRVVSNPVTFEMRSQPPAGSGMRFDGASRFLEAPDHDDLNVGDAFTVEAWVKIGDVQSERAFLSKVAPHRRGWSLSVLPETRQDVLAAPVAPARTIGEAMASRESESATGLYTFMFTVGDGLRFHDMKMQVDWEQSQPWPRIGADEWRHLAVVWNQGEATMYIDGRPARTTWTNVIDRVSPAAAPLSIGKAGGALGRLFEGELAHVRVWKVARTAREIESYLSLALRGDEEGLVACWPLEPDEVEEARELGPHQLTARQGALDQDTQRLPARSPADIYAAPKHFLVIGRITDAAGRPVADARITAHTGIDTLLMTGEARSGLDGRYVLRFAPNVMMLSHQGFEKPAPQAAIIRVARAGYYEENLGRHGALGMAASLDEAPEWIGGPGRYVVPDTPLTLDFALAPAITVRGRLVALSDDPFPAKTLWVKCEDGPPGLDVLAQGRTDGRGAFEFRDLPVAPMWLGVDEGADGAVEMEPIPFDQPGEYELRLTYDPNQEFLDAEVLAAPPNSVFTSISAVTGDGRQLLPTDPADTGDGFGLVFERFVTGSPNGNCFIDFDTGRVSPLPGGIDIYSDEFEFSDLWMRRGGPDAYGQIYEEAKGFIGYLMKTIAVSDDQWETITPEALQQALDEVEMPSANQEVYMILSEGQPSTFLFETREGGQGVLQILEVRTLANIRPGNPGGVRFRYKMLAQPRSTPTPSPSTPTATGTPEAAAPTPESLDPDQDPDWDDDGWATLDGDVATSPMEQVDETTPTIIAEDIDVVDVPVDDWGVGQVRDMDVEDTGEPIIADISRQPLRPMATEWAAPTPDPDRFEETPRPDAWGDWVQATPKPLEWDEETWTGPTPAAPGATPDLWESPQLEGDDAWRLPPTTAPLTWDDDWTDRTPPPPPTPGPPDDWDWDAPPSDDWGDWRPAPTTAPLTWDDDWTNRTPPAPPTPGPPDDWDGPPMDEWSDWRPAPTTAPLTWDDDWTDRTPPPPPTPEPPDDWDGPPMDEWSDWDRPTPRATPATPGPVLEVIQPGIGDVVSVIDDRINLEFSAFDVDRIMVECAASDIDANILYAYSMDAFRRRQAFDAMQGVRRVIMPVGLSWGRATYDPLLRIDLKNQTQALVEMSRAERPQFRFRLDGLDIYFDSQALVDLVDQTLLAGLRSELLGRDWTPRRYYAAMLLFDMGDRSGAGILAASLEADRSLDVRVQAAVRLARIREPMAFPALVDLALRIQSDDYATKIILNGIPRYENQDLVGVLTRIGRENKSLDAQQRALEALARIGTPEAIDALISLWGAGRNYSLVLLQACGRFFTLDEYEQCIEWWQVNRGRSRMKLLADGLEFDTGGFGSLCVEEMQKLDPSEAVFELAQRLPAATGAALERLTDGLERITGQRLGTDKEAWRRWWQAQTSGLSEAAMAADDPFAGSAPVAGVQSRLRVDAPVWREGEAPVLRIDLRNQGSQRMRYLNNQSACEINLNGQWYYHPDWTSDPWTPLEPGQMTRDLTVELAEGFWFSREDGAPLRLRPGRYAARAAVTLEPAGSDGDEPVLVMSDAIGFTIARASAGGPEISVAGPSRRLTLFGYDLTDSPMSTRPADVADLFERNPPWSETYRLREQVDIVHESAEGAVYYLPERNVFYIERFRVGAVGSQYYGPLPGSPRDRLTFDDESASGATALSADGAVAGLRCVAALVKDRLTFGEEPQLRVALINTTREPLDIIGYARRMSWVGDEEAVFFPCAEIQYTDEMGRSFRVSFDSAQARPEAVRLEPGAEWIFHLPPGLGQDGDNGGGAAAGAPSSMYLPGGYEAQVTYAIRPETIQRFGAQLVFGADGPEDLVGRRPDRLWQGVVESNAARFQVSEAPGAVATGTDAGRAAVATVDRGEDPSGEAPLQLTIMAGRDSLPAGETTIVNVRGENRSSEPMVVRGALNFRWEGDSDAGSHLYGVYDGHLTIPAGSSMGLGTWEIGSQKPLAPGRYAVWCELVGPGVRAGAGEPVQSNRVILEVEGPPDVSAGAAAGMGGALEAFIGEFAAIQAPDQPVFAIEETDGQYVFIDYGGAEYAMVVDGQSLVFESGADGYRVRRDETGEAFQMDRLGTGPLAGRSVGLIRLRAGRPAEDIFAAALAGDLEQTLAFLDDDSTKISDRRQGDSLLHSAIQGGSWEVVDHLLTLRPDLEVEDGLGRRPLHLAASLGREDLVLALIEAGARLDARSAQLEMTALHEAVASRVAPGGAPSATVELLLAHGADYALTDGEGLTPLALARQVGRDGLAEMLQRGRGSFWSRPNLRKTLPEPEGVVELVATSEGRHHWRIRPNWPVKVTLAWYGWDGLVREHGGGTLAHAVETPVDVYLRLSADRGDLVIERSLSWRDADGRQSDDVLHRVAAAPAAVLESRVLEGASRMGRDYAIFWEGRFVRGGETVKTVIVALRVDHRNARPLRPDRPPFDLSEQPFEQSLFGGPILP